MWVTAQILGIESSTVAAFGALFVSVASTFVAFWKGRSDKDTADRSDWREGTQGLLDQVQEERAELKIDVADCRKKCEQVQRELDETKAELMTANRRIDRLEDENEALRRELAGDS